MRCLSSVFKLFMINLTIKTTLLKNEIKTIQFFFLNYKYSKGIRLFKHK